MSALKDITSAVMPYVAAGVVGYLIVRGIARSDVGKTIADLPNKAGEKANEITSRTPAEWGKKLVDNLPVVAAARGDWGKAIANTNPVGIVWNLLN